MKARQQTRKKGKDIRRQIMSGYLRVVALIAVLAAIMFISFYWIQNSYAVVMHNQTNRSGIQIAIAGHYKWLDQLSTSILTDVEFEGSLDHNTCSLGQWKASISQKDMQIDKIQTAVEAADVPHETIHTLAKELLEISKTNREKAFQRYEADIKPQTVEVIRQLEIIDGYYEQAIEHASASLTFFITFAILCTIFLTGAVIAISIIYGSRLSSKISRPVTSISEWAKKLALGIQDTEFDAALFEENRDNEVGAMIRSFTAMATSIEENVNVIRRVADGDMTAFINIRSDKDSLGKNLYRMVQSNDLLFNDIIQIAHTVAAGSEEIAKASQSLAHSASLQATTVQELSTTVEQERKLIVQNNDKAHSAQKITDQIENDSQLSNKRLQQLVDSVNDIRTASERISTVIKSIDDIAFQTNVLALNAAVEAARAGTAGKGFAVVADEVRSLANRSAEAAKESKVLIEDTIHRTAEGSEIAGDAAVMFQNIMGEIERIVTIIQEVASSSDEQLRGIEQVNEEIDQISQSAAQNAAISEETAAASQAMSGDSQKLREAMRKFTLRRRVPGQAYIPPEKANDPDFIRHANEAYQKAQETGRYGCEYIDPSAGQLEME